eukprot:76583-Rhodomonas_salina.2
MVVTPQGDSDDFVREKGQVWVTKVTVTCLAAREGDQFWLRFTRATRNEMMEEEPFKQTC